MQGRIRGMYANLPASPNPRNKREELSAQRYIQGWVNAVASPFKAPSAKGIPTGGINTNYLSEYNYKSNTSITPRWKLQNAGATVPPGQSLMTRTFNADGLKTTYEAAMKVNTVPDGVMVFSVPARFAFEVSNRQMKVWQDLVNTVPQTDDDGDLAVPAGAPTGTIAGSKQMFKFLDRIVPETDESGQPLSEEVRYRKSIVRPDEDDKVADDCKPLYPRYVPIVRAGRQFFNGWSPESNPVMLPTTINGETILQDPAIPQEFNTKLYSYPTAGFTRARSIAGKVNVAVWYHRGKEAQDGKVSLQKGATPLTDQLPRVGEESSRTLIPIGIEVLETSGFNAALPHTTFDEHKILHPQATAQNQQDRVKWRDGALITGEVPVRTKGYGGPGYNLGPVPGEPITRGIGWSGDVLSDGARVLTKSLSDHGWKTQLPALTQDDATSLDNMMGPLNWPFNQDAYGDADTTEKVFEEGTTVVDASSPDMLDDLTGMYGEKDKCWNRNRNLRSRHVGGGFKLNPDNQLPGKAKGRFLRWEKVQKFILGHPMVEGDLFRDAMYESKPLTWEYSLSNKGKRSGGGISIRDNFAFNYATDTADLGLGNQSSDLNDVWANYTRWETYFNSYPQVSGEVQQARRYAVYTLGGTATDPTATLDTDTPAYLSALPVSIDDYSEKKEYLRYTFKEADIRYWPGGSNVPWGTMPGTAFDIPYMLPLPQENKLNAPSDGDIMTTLEDETHKLADLIKDQEVIEKSVRFDDVNALDQFVQAQKIRWEKSLESEQRKTQSKDLWSEETESLEEKTDEPCPKPFLPRRKLSKRGQRLDAIMQQQRRLSEILQYEESPGHFQELVVNGVATETLEQTMKAQQRHCITTVDIQFTAGATTGKNIPTDALDTTVRKTFGFQYECVNIREHEITQEMYWPNPAFRVPTVNTDSVAMVARALKASAPTAPGKPGDKGFPIVMPGNSFWSFLRKGWGFITEVVSTANEVVVAVNDIFIKAPQ